MKTLAQLRPSIEQLSQAEQIELMALLDELIHKKETNSATKHQITELNGLGKEIWQNINIEQYLEEERKQWD
ncbi:MAG: hypothetical protein MUE85_19640 [Microscillaceae bacterium]|jgi:hypothetical protein|nr:hypothetical protein [Microscillaceae bacterium]